MPLLDLGARKVEYTVVKGTSRRYTYFRVRPDSVLEVAVPRGRRVDLEKAIRAKGTWLLRELDRVSATRNVLDRDMVMFGGMLYRAEFAVGRQEGLSFDRERGVVDVMTTDRRRLRELVRRAFLRESSSYVISNVPRLSPLLGVRPSRVDVREIGKWGYCTRTGRLSFSWQLAALSDRLREYVVLHELTHLLEFNHSLAFKKKLGAVCPDFRERERELGLIAPYDRLSLP